MKTSRLLLLGAAALGVIGIGAVASAQPGPGRGGAAMFARMDTNNDGRVTWDEGWAFVQARFAEADTDRDGALTPAELQAARLRAPRQAAADAPAPRPEVAERRARWAGMMFRALDADRDGKVTLAEARPAAEARFRALDANGDGAVSRDELPQRGQRGGAPAGTR